MSTFKHWLLSSNGIVNVWKLTKVTWNWFKVFFLIKSLLKRYFFTKKILKGVLLQKTDFIRCFFANFPFANKKLRKIKQITNFVLTLHSKQSYSLFYYSRRTRSFFFQYKMQCPERFFISNKPLCHIMVYLLHKINNAMSLKIRYYKLQSDTMIYELLCYLAVYKRLVFLKKLKLCCWVLTSSRVCCGSLITKVECFRIL